MAWSRVALVTAAAEGDDILDKVAAVFGYKTLLDKPKVLNTQAVETMFRTANLRESDTPNIAESTRPPARFIRVKKVIAYNQQDTQRPSYLTDPSMKLSAKATGSYDFPAADPLLTSSRLLPFILTNLGVGKDSRRLNHKLITKRVSQAKAIQRLPYLAQLRWPKRLHVIVDSGRHLEPYWEDFDSIIDNLKQQMGTSAVKAITFDEETLDQTIPLFSPWPIQDDDVEDDWCEPPAYEPVLILSDLGISHPKSRLRVLWRRFASKHLKQSNVLTLSPATRSPVCKKSVKTLRPNPLNDGQFKSHAIRSGYVNPSLTNNELRKILTLLSALPLIDVALLRKLRVALNWGHSDLEGVIWNHPEMISTGVGICLKPSLVEAYRMRYKQQFAETPVAEALWCIANEHHQHAYEGLKSMEGYSRMALEGETQQSSFHYMQQLAASLEQTDEASEQYQALAAQCKSVLAFCPDSLSSPKLSDLAHELLTVAYREEIEKEDWQAIPLNNVRLDKLQSVLGQQYQKEYRRWYVTHTASSALAITIAPHQLKEGYYHYPPLIVFNALKNLPINVSHDEYGAHAFTDSVTVDLGQQELTVESGESSITLDTITKPNWATAIGRNKDGLWASFDWIDETIICRWNLVDGVGAWRTKEPFGFDQYGLYTDLALTPKTTQRFRWIPAGTFQMGSPVSEPEREPWGNETLHSVTLSEGFWLADTTVTQAQWQAVTGKNPSNFTGDENRPVERVSWNNSQNFISQLMQHHSLAFQLPSEAQWEYACRAGTTTPFSFGKNITPEQVNYNGNYPYDDAEKGENREATVPVKSLPCNAWGLYEMHGNVFEWCNDSWFEDLGSEPSYDPKANSSARAERVVRGGSWSGTGGLVRSAGRSHSSPNFRYDYLGLRLSFGHPSTSSGGGAAKTSANSPAASTASRVVDRRRGRLSVGGVRKFTKGLFGSKDEK